MLAVMAGGGGQSGHGIVVTREEDCRGTEREDAVATAVANEWRRRHGRGEGEVTSRKWHPDGSRWTIVAEELAVELAKRAGRWRTLSLARRMLTRWWRLAMVEGGRRCRRMEGRSWWLCSFVDDGSEVKGVAAEATRGGGWRSRRR